MILRFLCEFCGGKFCMSQYEEGKLVKHEAPCGEPCVGSEGDYGRLAKHRTTCNTCLLESANWKSTVKVGDRVRRTDESALKEEGIVTEVWGIRMARVNWYGFECCHWHERLVKVKG